MMIAALAAALMCVVAFLLWIRRLEQPPRVAFAKQTPSIMGTETTLKAVVERGEDVPAQKALQAAETVLRDVESRMSVWMGTTELARFNAARAGEVVPLSPLTLEVLKAAREVTEQTQGAFDPTCRPVLELWRECQEDDREPQPEEMVRALGRVGWRWIRLEEKGAEKLQDGVSVDLGAIAKGYAVDRAVEAMGAAGARGGMVQCGGDLRVFGLAERSERWTIGINDPFNPEGSPRPEVLLISDLAVSTSGNYRRYFTIQGRRRSHIIDPRNGQPVDAVPQVTVVANSATLSEGWSTALSVLGPEGLKLLPAGVECMLITETNHTAQVYKSPHFDALLAAQ
jgi:thiamine biosynthesis lipoprotein